MNETPTIDGLACPMPLPHRDQIVMGHGSGGKMSHDLIKRVFLAGFNSPVLAAGNDFGKVGLPTGASLDGHLSISTDSHIVFPLFFPGGDIGKLAVCGTVNDMSMSGAVPLYLTASFILEEGFSIQKLQEIVGSMQQTAEQAGVQIVAGDTKVAEKGKADGVFITTTGIGWMPDGRNIGGQFAEPGDAVLVSGTVGDHGIAVLTARGELGLEADVKSDVAPLNQMLQDILSAAPGTHVLRDPTRGGLATTLNEIASQSAICILLDESTIPVHPTVQSACEMLGFDPLYIANEGKVIVITPQDETEAALDAMRQNEYGKNAAIIGAVQEKPAGRVLLKTPYGSTRILDVLAGEMLPRIC
jgi:hydrogenase expression/formation protein HypE